jgi:zinc transport system substrate-binding protein
MRLPALLLLSLLCSVSQAAEVLASIRPLALIAAAVTDGQGGRVSQLVPAGASSHHYQPRPSDRLALARADVVLWIGPAHERFLTRMLAASPNVLTAQSLPGISRKLQRRPNGDGAIAGTVDPHLWLEPDNAVVIARALAEALARREPAQAEAYRKNAAAFANRMATFKASQAVRFQGLPSRSFVAYHDAYQYIEPMLGLNFRGSLLQSPESKPGAKHFLLMSQRIRQEGIFCFLGEPGFDKALAKHVFNGRPTNPVEVDELFTTAPLDATGFEAGLLQMTDAINGCLGGK